MKTKELRNRVLQAVLTGEVSKGHLKWKVSDLARHTGVSRPLIYYHFGKTKSEILTQSLELFADDYYGLSPAHDRSLSPEIIFPALMRTRKMFLKNPALVVFYQRSRMKASPLNDQLVAIEKRFQAKLKTSFPHLSAPQIEALHALLHGMISAPFLSEKGLASALKMIGFSSGEND